MFQSAAVAVATIVLISALPYGGARSIGEEQYGELLRARQQEAFHYHRTPEYDESNHFTAEEAHEMRAVRRIKRSWLNTMETQLQAEEEVGGTKIQTESDSIDTNKQPTRQADEEDVNLYKGLTGLFEGDIVLTPGQKELLRKLNEEDGGVSEQAIRAHFLYRWENGVVPYVLEKSLRNHTISAILDAMDEIQTQTESCVVFKEKSNEQDYVKFISGYGCWSEVGRLGGVQAISIMNTDSKGYTCALKGIAMHEIMHTLGRFHEQNRFDRASYVRINWSNIIQGWEHNFKIQPHSVADTQRLCYDYDSIMHYGPKDFANDRQIPVITAKNGAEISGQRKYLTGKDRLHIIKAYCPARLHSS